MEKLLAANCRNPCLLDSISLLAAAARLPLSWQAEWWSLRTRSGNWEEFETVFWASLYRGESAAREKSRFHMTIQAVQPGSSNLTRPASALELSEAIHNATSPLLAEGAKKIGLSKALEIPSSHYLHCQPSTFPAPSHPSPPCPGHWWCWWMLWILPIYPTLPTNIYIVKVMAFPVVMYGWESWTIKKGEWQRVHAFGLVLEKILESPLDWKEMKAVHPEWNKYWIFIGRTNAEAEAPILWPPDVKSWLIWKDPDARKDWRQEKRGMTQDKMAGWHHRLNGHEFE